MNKVTEMFLQYLRHNQEVVKHQKVSLIAKYQKCNKVNVNTEPDIPLQEEKPKKVYVRDMKNKYEIKRKHIYDWIAHFKPTHFLTIQFPMNMRSPDLNVSKNHLRKFMARFEQHLVGSRWTGRHVRFYAFAEKGQHEVYSIATCSKKGSKKSLFDMLSFINTQKGRIHIVCKDFYDIFQDAGDLQILEPLITMGKITIHILKQNFIIDKNSYNADMIKRINIMLLTRYCYISTLSHNIKVAKNRKKSIGKS